MEENSLLLQDIFQTAKDISFVVSDIGSKPHILEFSPGAEAIFGYRKEEVLGKEVSILHLPHDAEQFPDLIEEMGRTKKGISFEITLLRKSGEEFPAFFTANPLFNKKGIMWGILGIAIDISKQKDLAKSLQEREAKYRILSENASDVIWTTDMHLNYTYISPSVEKVYGYTPQEMMALPMNQAILPKSLELVQGIFQEVLDLEEKGLVGDQSKTIEYEHLRKDGSIIWVESRVRFLRNDKGKPIGVIGITRDITERKESERQIKESEKKYRTLFEQSVAGIYLYNLKGQIIDVNEIASIQSGYSREELQEMSIFHLHPHGEDKKNRSKKEILKSWPQWQPGERYTFEEEHLCKDGRLIPVKVTTGLVDYKEEPAILSMVLDITEEKKLEKTLQYQNNFQKLLANISYTFINTPRSWMDEAINNALFNIGRFFQVDRTYIYQFSLDDLYMSNTHEWCREGIGSQKDFIQNAPINDLPWMIKEIRSKDHVLIPDINQLPYEEERKEFQRQKIQSLLCLRITMNERVFGFIGMDSVNKKMNWSHDEITLLKIIAEILSSAFTKHKMEEDLALRTKELDEEIKKARLIHEHILPHTFPCIKGLSFAAHFQPAEKLGGDFYDLAVVHNKLLLYLSDISGHGLEGSLLSVFIKNTIKGFLSFSSKENLTPSNILKYLTIRFQEENFPEEYFICIFLALVDLETMEMTYAGAGFHDTPLVEMGDGAQISLFTKGLFISPLFSLDKYHFTEKKILLTPGTTLFFNTDGLTEEGKVDHFYKDRLSQVFYAKAHLTPDRISQSIWEDFISFNSGISQGKDDITFLVMQLEKGMKELQLDLKTGIQSLKGLDREVLSFIYGKEAPLSDTDERVNSFLAGLKELVVNAMEHGNQCNPNKRVSIHITRKDGSLKAIVEDQGDGFNWLEKIPKPFDIKGQSVRGRGIPMTIILGDTLHYNPKGNQAIFTLNLKS